MNILWYILWIQLWYQSSENHSCFNIYLVLIVLNWFVIVTEQGSVEVRMYQNATNAIQQKAEGGSAKSTLATSTSC